MLGGGDDRRLWRVGDDDPALGGGREVDVVHPHSRPADGPEPVGALDQVGRQAGGAADDDRVVLPIVAARSPSSSTSTSKRSRSLDPGLRDRPRTRTFTPRRARRAPRARPGRPSPARRRRRPRRARAPERGERRGDVLHVHVAEVSEADDLAALRPLAADDRDARPLAHGGDDRLPVDLRRHPDRCDHSRAVRVGRKELEPHGLHAGAGCAAEAQMALLGGREPVGENQVEGDVEAAHERDRRREGRLAQARGDGPLPVHVVARERGGLGRLEGSREDRGKRQAGQP